MRKFVPFVLVFLVLILAPIVAAQAGVLATMPISSDPYTNPDSQHQTQVEPDNFAFGNTVVAAFQTGRYFDGGASNNGWATSTNGGNNYTIGFLPGTTPFSTPPGPYDRVSDPAVAYDARHDVWMIASLAIGSNTNSVIVNRSTNGGTAWGNPVVVSTSAFNFYDKEWIACDNFPASPYYGHCYVTWDDANLGLTMYVSTSTDGGLTWGPKLSPSSGGFGLGGQPVIQPNGRVIIPASTGGSLFSFFSWNGGSRWTRTFSITNQTSHTVAGSLRSSTFLPSAAVDEGGKVYLVWADCRFRSGCASNDIVMTTSTNGRTWSSVVRIPIDPVTSTVDHFIPGLGATGSGNSARLALTYYYYPNANCTSATCQLYAGFISSADGGANWSAPQTLGGPMTLSWIASTSQGRMVGDYVSTTFVGNTAVPVFSLASAPIGSTFQQATWGATMPVLTTGAYPNAVQADRVLSTQGDPLPLSQPIQIP